MSSARPKRTIEDRLREEYFDLLPDIRRVLDELEAEVRHCVVPLSLRLHEYERLVITSRVKECESALDSLRRCQEGVRVLVFPHGRWAEAGQKLRNRFAEWTADPVPGYEENDEPLALKYFGYCKASKRVRAEFQIVPMLTALFWEVEHSVMYKPSPRLRGVARSLELQQRTREVLKALQAFEDEFANLIRHDPLAKKKKKKKK